jgi:hypothetical protein
MVTGWLLLTAFVYLVAGATLPAEWRWALVCTLLLPIAILAKGLLEGVFELAFLRFTKFLFWAITFGSVRPERSSECVRFPWYKVVRGADGKWVMDEDVAALIAIAVLGALSIAAYFALR